MVRGYVRNVGLAYAEVARTYGARPALKLPGNEIVTHGELNKLANRVAGVLAGRGVGAGSVVGIVHTKSAACYACMLACAKLGAIYVNLDEANPLARLAHIFSSCRPALVVTDRAAPDVREKMVLLGMPVLDLGEPASCSELAASSPAEPLQSEYVTGADPAYIMYTSGSTGVPKGAIMSHANVVNFGAWTRERFEITARDVLTNVNPMYFDNSVFDFYGALLNGAALAPVFRDDLRNPLTMLAHIEAAQCSVWFSVPSFLIYLTTLGVLSERRLPNVRTFVFGGEGYPKPELRKLFALFGERSRLVNVYGPTECTCICSAWDVTAGDLEAPGGFVTLGPIAKNFSILVIDERNQPAPSGQPGELCLLGPQVGLGYVNDPERTRDAFVDNPANTAWNERMYRTGDIVRLRADGRTIDFVGRKDNQIKHMGYRIELEEIEAAIDQIEGVVQSVVLHKADRNGLKVLVAYMTTEGEMTSGHIRAKLVSVLPSYMIPQRYALRRVLPKNANGKVDRVALAAEAGTDDE